MMNTKSVDRIAELFDKYRVVGKSREAVWEGIPIQLLGLFRAKYRGYRVRYRGPRFNLLPPVAQRERDQRRSNCLKDRASYFSVYTTGL
jgi:hypothetical protein